MTEVAGCINKNTCNNTIHVFFINKNFWVGKIVIVVDIKVRTLHLFQHLKRVDVVTIQCVEKKKKTK
jgi:hypothetical protein